MNASRLRGRVFIKAGTPLPEHLHVTFADGRRRWMRVVDLDSSALERVAIRSGWHFCFIPAAVKAGAFDPRPECAMNGALKKIMRALEHSCFNAFEVTEATSHRLLILHHADVRANPRHLWSNPFVHEPGPHYYTNSSRDFKLLFQKAAESRPMNMKGI